MLTPLLALVFGLYTLVLVLNWVVAATDLRVSGRLREGLGQCATPFLRWVCHVIDPPWLGHDLARPTTVLIMLLIRAILRHG